MICPIQSLMWTLGFRNWQASVNVKVDLTKGATLPFTSSCPSYHLNNVLESLSYVCGLGVKFQDNALTWTSGFRVLEAKGIKEAWAEMKYSTCTTSCTSYQNTSEYALCNEV